MGSKILNPVPLTFNCLSPCPPPLKKPCCTLIVEHQTQLVPPAKKGSTIVTKEVFATIEKVCKCVVVICGMIRKTIAYTAVIDGLEVPNHTIIDEVPFQCMIDDIEAKEGDQFKVIKKEILCEVFAEEQNFGKDNEGNITLAFKFVEKDIIKICIEKQK